MSSGDLWWKSCLLISAGVATVAVVVSMKSRKAVAKSEEAATKPPGVKSDADKKPERGVPMSHSRIRMCHIIQLEDCGTGVGGDYRRGGVRLGPVLNWMDMCACLSAERVAGISCVTVSMDHLSFDSTKARDGDAMIVEAQLVRAFKSSAEVVVRVYADSLDADQDLVVFACAFFVFVRMDRGVMPPVFPECLEETREFEQSLERRKIRQNKADMIRSAQSAWERDNQSRDGDHSIHKVFIPLVGGAGSSSPHLMPAAVVPGVGRGAGIAGAGSAQYPSASNGSNGSSNGNSKSDLGNVDGGSDTMEKIDGPTSMEDVGISSIDQDKQNLVSRSLSLRSATFGQLPSASAWGMAPVPQRSVSTSAQGEGELDVVGSPSSEKRYFQLSWEEEAEAARGRGIPAEASLLKYTLLVLPPHANHMGNTFGGCIMEWAEEAALLSARRHLRAAAVTGLVEGGASGVELVTVFVDGVSFLKPSTVGDRIVMRAQCTRSFGPLVEVEVSATALDDAGHNHRHILSAYMSVCARRRPIVPSSTGRSHSISGTSIPESFRYVALPDVLPATAQQQQRYDTALGRMLVAAVRLGGEVVGRDSVAPNASSSGAPAKASEGTSKGGLGWSLFNVEMRGAAPLISEFEEDSALALVAQARCALLSALPVDPDADPDWEFLPPPTRQQSSNTSSTASSPADSPKHGVANPVLRGGKVPATLEEQARVSVWVKHSDRLAKVFVRVLVPAPVEVVEKMITDFDRRATWDSLLMGRSVRSLSENGDTELIWLATAPEAAAAMTSTMSATLAAAQGNTPSEATDYALLRSRQTLPDGRVLLPVRSVSTPHVPPVPGFRRGELLPSGFLLGPGPTQPGAVPCPAGLTIPPQFSGRTTKVDYLLQLEPALAAQFQRELWGISQELRRSLGRLSTAALTIGLMTKPPVKLPASRL
mmetsp:Transcript_61350/g.164773  ORF Transcript_61350/g.164773 Transcript_61350/m.164773 type:complete len:934 (-) Transcript_61350:288-3089(-)